MAKKRVGPVEPKKKTTRAKRAPKKTSGARAKKSSASKSPPRPSQRGATPKQTPSEQFPIAGIGASAGGLEAFGALLRELPSKSGMAYVLLQHMDPVHKSMLAELLKKTTSMPVAEVTQGMKVKPDHVYVIPPDTTMSIHNGTLKLVVGRGAVTKHMPIDHFFRSLAEDRQNNAIGVILSGSANDGTDGLKAIKAHGGISFAQDPDTAAHSGMPVSAISSGSVDSVLPPEAIAKELSRLVNDPYVVNARDVPSAAAEADAGGGGSLREILRLLRKATGVDFSEYKPSTIQRRIARRTALRQADSLSNYAKIVRKDPAEIAALYEDIFIHVTGFFRDPEAYDALRTTVIRKIADVTRPEEPIRVWITGCSSGEEVYSTAMLLLEELDDRASSAKVQIFGTDILEPSIELARAGVYRESAVADISPERLRRFFTKVEGGYQVIKSVRERCIFARQDLANDPPFSRIDLIACRNVLIYMGAELQRKIMSSFHYALKPSGFLFLGKSESLTAHADLFTLKNRKFKIYCRRPHSNRAPGPLTRSVHQAAEVVEARLADNQPAFDLRRDVDRIIIDKYAPAAVAVDTDLHIIEARGDTAPYLSLPTGKVNLQLLGMARPELALELRTAIHRAKKQRTAVSTEAIPFEHEGHHRKVSLEVVPIQGGTVSDSNYLVIFEPAAGEPAEPRTGPAPAENHGDSAIAGLEQELSSTRRHLRSIIEDQEALNEELKAANEEILSSNEELQSTNEELETAKEELQSSNEELTTLNEELQNRNTELDQLTTDLSNLLVGIELPIVIVGSDLRIRRFTPAAAEIFNLISADVGRPISNIKSNLDVPELDRWIAEVVERDRTSEREVQDRDGHWYSLRMKPFRSAENKMAGILMALTDIHALKRDLELETEARVQAEAIVETVRQPLVLLDAELRVMAANRAFYEAFKGRQSGTEQRSFFEIGSGRWNIPKLRERLENVLSEQQRITDLEVRLALPRIGEKRFLLNARPIHLPGTGLQMVLVAIEDITKVRDALEQSEERFRLLAENAGDIVSLHDSKGRYLYVSPAVELNLGYRPDELLGRSPRELAHREEAGRFSKTLAGVAKTGRENITTYRVRRSSGEYVWLESLIRPVLNSKSRVKQFQCSSRDVSQREAAEQALRASESELKRLAAGLLQAQDQERQRIAQELHDDFNQRLGMLAHDVGLLEEQLPAARNKLRTSMRTLRERAGGLAEDASRIAYQLHPSAVDHLGLVATLESYCTEFSNREGIRTRFSRRTVPASIPSEIALCLYRIAQESLHNVAKHSEATEARVAITGLKNAIKLTVSDGGVGFDRDQPGWARGLGLAGMEERARLVGGSLTIKSKRGAGTRIDVRVPLSAPATPPK